MVEGPLGVNRPHVLMNKFSGPEDDEYRVVAGKIQETLRKIREGRPLEQADAWIRENHYTNNKLNVNRLSDNPLPMDQCYINLAIVEQLGHGATRSSEESDWTGPKFQSFSFHYSLDRRLRGQTETSKSNW